MKHWPSLSQKENTISNYICTDVLEKSVTLTSRQQIETTGRLVFRYDHTHQRPSRSERSIMMLLKYQYIFIHYSTHDFTQTDLLTFIRFINICFQTCGKVQTHT